jgi:hypothetical protein
LPIILLLTPPRSSYPPFTVHHPHTLLSPAHPSPGFDSLTLSTFPVISSIYNLTPLTLPISRSFALIPLS